MKHCIFDESIVTEPESQRERILIATHMLRIGPMSKSAVEAVIRISILNHLDRGSN
jgi:hypothetical protein